MMRSSTFGHFSEPVREFAAKRAAEAAGLAMLLGSGALTLALVSWSTRDPSLNHATDGRVRNLLGTGGAVAADLLMQLIGFAAIAAVLPIAIQGLRLLTQRPRSCGPGCAFRCGSSACCRPPPSPRCCR